MNIQDFIQEFVDKKISNTKINPNAIDDFIKSKLKIRTYIPFTEKCQIVELVVSANTTEEHGIKKIDSTRQFIGFIVSMLITHTDLELDQVDPIQSYDMLSEVGLIEPIIACFQKDYTECETLLKITVADALEYNNVNAVVARFLDGILKKLDGVGEMLKDSLGNLNIQDILGDFNQEDLNKLKGFLNKFN